MNYTVLHIHDMLSNAVTNIDSITTFDDYVIKAKDCGMTALASSNHGSVLNWVHKKNVCEAAGMKYIHAEEFYVTETLSDKIRDNYHCLLIAKNYNGVLELNKLSSKSFNREDNSFYYVPRISFDDLINTSDNIIISTACLGGILHKGNKDIKNRFFQFIIQHKDRCYLELQPHLDTEQIAYNQMLYNLSKKYGINMVMCTDTHALNSIHVEGRKILQKAKNIHFDGEDNFHLEFLSYDELVALCRQQNAIPMEDYLNSIENTNKIAAQIEPFELDYSYKYPHLWGDNSEQIFVDKIKQGLKWRGVDKFPNYQEYIERIKYELKAYKHNGAIDFMLLMEDIIAWCHTVDIQVGYGRGSVNGSVIAWLLGITEMDAIKHNLNFDRFMNVERVSLSDIDTDFPPSRIDEVKQYIFNKHGLYCSDIVTFNTIALKGAIRDVGRALEIPLDIVGNICDNVEVDEKSLREQYPELFKYVDMVNGTIVSIGNHPCGEIVAASSIDDKIGLLTTSTDTVPISQINMKEIDGLNYVKLDLLKLDTIELINETCKLANIERLTPDNVDITDVNVWNSIRDDTTGIFQWEGTTGDRYIKQLLSDNNIKAFREISPNVDYMTLLSIGNSAIRPAGASYRDDLGNGIVRKSGSQAIDDFLKPTFGYLVFQEQIIQFLHGYCGYTMGEADVVRRHFAKKYGTGDDIPKIKSGFIKTMKEKYNMPQEEAEETIVAFIKVIEDASRYLFSLNHSQPYSYEGYVSGWLRYYYPLEFLTVCLNINKDKEEKTAAVTKYAVNHGIEIKSPLFRHSKADYMFDKATNSIYKGIASIKNMNAKCADELYELRDNQYPSFIDLLYELKDLTINSRQLDILIKIGFFNEFGDVNNLLFQVKYFDELYKCKNLKVEKAQLLKIPAKYLEQYSDKHTEKTYTGIHNKELLTTLMSIAKIRPCTIYDKIKWQMELLGYCNLTDPNAAGDMFLVSSIEQTSYNTYITLYRLYDAWQQKYKVNKRFYTKNPLQSGDIIQVIFEEKPKWKKVDDEFVRTGETEIVLKAYRKIT